MLIDMHDKTTLLFKLSSDNVCYVFKYVSSTLNNNIRSYLPKILVIAAYIEEKSFGTEGVFEIFKRKQHLKNKKSALKDVRVT